MQMDWQQIIDNDELQICPPQDAAMHGIFYPNTIAKLKHQPKVGVLAVFEFEPNSKYPAGQVAIGGMGLDYLTKEKQAGRIESGFVPVP